MIGSTAVSASFPGSKPSSLSDLKHRGENSPARVQILTVLQRQYRDIAQKTGEICAGPADLQPMLFKSDRLLGYVPGAWGCPK
jgi:hypothetical protein